MTGWRSRLAVMAPSIGFLDFCPFIQMTLLTQSLHWCAGLLLALVSFFLLQQGEPEAALILGSVLFIVMFRGRP